MCQGIDNDDAGDDDNNKDGKHNNYARVTFGHSNMCNKRGSSIISMKIIIATIMILITFVFMQ